MLGPATLAAWCARTDDLYLVGRTVCSRGGAGDSDSCSGRKLELEKGAPSRVWISCKVSLLLSLPQKFTQRLFLLKSSKTNHIPSMSGYIYPINCGRVQWKAKYL